MDTNAGRLLAELATGRATEARAEREAHELEKTATDLREQERSAGNGRK